MSEPWLSRDSVLWQQLDAWRAKGYDPQLWGKPNGWILILDMTRWGMRDIRPEGTEMILRFATEEVATPQAAIEAALKVIQP